MWKRDARQAPAPDMAIVEAATAQKALEDVSARYGSRAEILGATKVLRGGIGGFFARELIQLQVRTGTEGGDCPQAPADLPTPSGADGDGRQQTSAVSRLLGALSDSQDDRERTFAQKLRNQLSAQRAPQDLQHTEHGTPSGEQSPTPAPVTADGRVPTQNPVLRHMRAYAAQSGLGRAHLSAVESDAMGLVAAVRDRARTASADWQHHAHWAPGATAPPTASTTDQVLSVDAEIMAAPVGASATALHMPPAHIPPADAPPGSRSATSSRLWDPDALRALGLPGIIIDALMGSESEMGALDAVAKAVASLCRPLPGGMQLLAGPRAGVLSPALDLPLILPPGPTPADGPVACKVLKKDRAWVARHIGDRWLHVVVGGRGWEGLCDQGPLAVSWTRPEDLPAALRMAAVDGLVLGYDGTRGTRRASPEDVAITLRELLVNK